MKVVVESELEVGKPMLSQQTVSVFTVESFLADTHHPSIMDTH